MAILSAIGTLWLNALKMTVIPLVVSLLITGIASLADAASSGRLAMRALGAFAAMLLLATIYAVVLYPTLLGIFPVRPEAAASFVAVVGDPPPPAKALDFASWLANLAPANPIAAAANESMLSLTVFAIFFGFAATRLPAQQREPLVGFFRAVGDTLIVVVRWVLVAAPIGVFCLAIDIGLKAGLNAVEVLLHYIIMCSAVTFGSMLIAIAFAVIGGGVGLSKFLAAHAPVLAVAISTRSSIASLPIMVERARDALRVPANVANLVLPLAVAVFRITSPVANFGVVFFLAHVYGLQPDIPTIIGACFVALAVSISAVGLPGQVSFFSSIVPICVAMGVPVQLLPAMQSVEVIPDIFRTIGNVTGDMAATLIARRGRDKDLDRGQKPSPETATTAAETPTGETPVALPASGAAPAPPP